VVTGSAAAAVSSLVHSGSAPLTGTVPRAPQLTGAGLHYDIPVTPDIEPGTAGWCSYPRFTFARGSRPPGLTNPLASSGTCGPAAADGRPIIIGGGGEESVFWMIVSSRVAGLQLGARTVISPRSDARLPNRWRAVVAFTPAYNPRTKPLDRFTTLPTPTPLDAHGRVIPLGTVPGPTQVPVRTIDPNHPPAGSCAIRAVRIAGVTRQWEVIATSVPTLGSRVDASALFSCARSWYLLDDRSPAISAAILLNARDPHQRAPALPGLAPTAYRGLYSEDGGSAGDITARRLGRAWLVVQGGTPMLRARLLYQLHAQGSALFGSTR
jgi:hypothetical protein